VITAEDAATFERCMAVGGFAVFPADTVYGLACDPDAKETVQRLHLLKRRSMDKPSAVMFFDAELALETLTELEGPVRDAARKLLPGAVTLLIPNPAHRFPLACGADPGTLGLRVPKLDTELRHVRWPVLQTSANFAGRPDPRRLQDVPLGLRDSAELILDGGELPGTPSTVVDLREYAKTGEYMIVRQGLLPAADIEARLAG
jgi:L-threonylcarbamoyladenylate synthase